MPGKKYSSSQVAEELGVSVSAAESSLMRAWGPCDGASQGHAAQRIETCFIAGCLTFWSRFENCQHLRRDRLSGC
jgi:hypothetical protein